MVIQFLERDVHTRRKYVVENVISKALSLSLFQEEDIVVRATRNQGVKDSQEICHDENCICMFKKAVSARFFLSSLFRTTQVANVTWPKPALCSAETRVNFA
jgi:hypothetical protein